MVNFSDHPEFKPDLSPKQIFKQGAFGGVYWRSIDSGVTKKNYKDQYKEFKFLKKISKEKLDNSIKDNTINKYKVHASLPLIYWEQHHWIHPQDPYGHMQWYCRFYNGRRTPDDKRQISRALGVLVRFGQRKNKSDRVKQSLHHWGWDANKDHSEYIKKIKGIKRIKSSLI